MRQDGFTLIEVLITITIISILASILVPISNLAVQRSKEMELRQNLRTIRAAIDDYKKAFDDGRIKKNIGDSGYPVDLITLEQGVSDIKSPDGRKVRFIRRIPKDPFDEGHAVEPHETWGLRSYQSDPDAPMEGDDVYDVYSKAEGTAIDGTLYRDW